MARILHVIDALTGAGPTRSLRASVQYLELIGHGYQHHVMTLRQPNYPPALARARQAGITIHQAPGDAAIRDLIESSDLVELHYWHSPACVEFLAAEWPPHRRLAWFKILGRHAPQVISSELLNTCDAVLLSSALSLELPAIRAASHLQGMVDVVPGLMEPDRLAGFRAEPHEGFVVSYIGTANTTKIHPDFVAMSAQADIPGARFVVCGSGDRAPLESAADRLGASRRFEFRGYVENIRSVLAITDVFGYPLHEHTWATSEKSLQEAMLAGIPPVVFAHGGIAGIVRHGENGLVVSSSREYAQALEYLYHNPAEKQRLGVNARAFVQEHFDGREAARRMHGLYQRLLQQPRRAISTLLPGMTRAERFARCMLPADSSFDESLHAQTASQAIAADRRLAASSAPAAHGEGGIVQFRNAYPDEPVFAGWCGLVLAAEGRWAQALAEFERARSLRPEDWRLHWYRAVALCHVRDRSSPADPFAEALDQASAAGLQPQELQCVRREAGRTLPGLFPL